MAMARVWKGGEGERGGIEMHGRRPRWELEGFMELESMG